VRTFIALSVVALITGCASTPGPVEGCPVLTGAYLADGYGFEDSRRKKMYLGDLPPLAGRQGEPGVVTVVRIEGPADGRLVFSAGDVSRELFRVELDESGFSCEEGLVLVEVSELTGEPLLLTGGVSTDSGAFRTGPDGSLYTHSFERDSGLLLGLPISFGLDNGWFRFRQYKGPPLTGGASRTR
jgi:hypothetical protein